MKRIPFIITIMLLTLFISCSQDTNDVDLDAIAAPTNIGALMKITQDNSGNVTFIPTGEGVTQFEIYYGDDSTEPGIVSPGGSNTHTYTEGNFQVKIVGIGVNGKTSETTQELTVSFLQPTDLLVTITAGSNLSVNVTAEASLETFFQVYFGENPSETPVEIIEGATATYTYAAAGTYQIRVVALSGGSATLEYVEDVVITNLFAAPAPTVPASGVISLFSDSYTNVPVDTWKTSWSQANLDDIDISGNATKKYSSLNFVGIEATSTPINATSMTHFHTDVWSSDFTQFKVKLVDFGANGTFAGGDDVEHEIVIASPAQETWVSIDIPLSAFTGLTTRAHIAQLIYVGAPSGNTTVYIDNVYFYNQGVSLTVAPTPTLPAANVISMFSDAYTNVPVNTWRTNWSQANLEDIAINGNAIKKYTALDFVGIEATTSPINATGMTHFHTDVWSSDFTTFKVKLVDFGANGTFGGGDDKEHEIIYTSPAQNTWISLDIPLSSFTGLTTRAHIAQLIYAGAPTANTTVHIDNVYFHN